MNITIPYLVGVIVVSFIFGGGTAVIGMWLVIGALASAVRPSKR